MWSSKLHKGMLVRGYRPPSSEAVRARPVGAGGRGVRGGGRGQRRRSAGSPRRALARHSSPQPHDRTTHARARCRITALNITCERDRQFRNGRAPCFEPVIDSASEEYYPDLRTIDLRRKYPPNVSLGISEPVYIVLPHRGFKINSCSRNL